MRPSGNRTNVTGTVTLLGSWNDDVFGSATDHRSFLAGLWVEHARAERMRLTAPGPPGSAHGRHAGELARALLSALAHPLE
jgi:hypothetical protein